MVTITVLLQDRRGAELKTAHVLDPPNEGFAVEPFATVVQLVRIQLKDGGNQAGAAGSISHGNIPLFPASGFLRFLATPDYDHEEEKCRPKFATDSCHEQVDPGYLYQSITIPELPLPGSPTVGGIFAAGLVLAAAVAVITGWSLRKRRISLKHRMGSATWSFGQSWGANVASGSALLGTFLTVIAFPDHPRIMDKNSYTILQILFSAIIALAPLIYGLIRRDVQANVNGIAATDSQGYVIMFLLAGGLVLWGALGQLATLGALIREFILSGGLGMLTGAILEALTLLLFILLIIYGLRSLYQTAKHLSADPATAEGVQPRPRVPDGMPLPKPDTVNRPMPEWSLL